MDGPAEESVAGRWFYCTVMTTPRPSPSGRCRKLATNCTIMRVRALCTPIPRCQVRPGSIRQVSSTGRQLMLTVGLTLWNSQTQRDPIFTQLVVNGSAVSVVLMVSLQRFWKADLIAGATKG